MALGRINVLDQYGELGVGGKEVTSVLDAFTHQVLPSQTAKAAPIEPEFRLWLAVLEDAINDYFRYSATPNLGAKAQGILDELNEFFHDESSDFPSFYSICEVLSLDPECLRPRILDRAKALREAALNPPRFFEDEELSSRS